MAAAVATGRSFVIVKPIPLVCQGAVVGGLARSYDAVSSPVSAQAPQFSGPVLSQEFEEVKKRLVIHKKSEMCSLFDPLYFVLYFSSSSFQPCGHLSCRFYNCTIRRHRVGQVTSSRYYMSILGIYSICWSHPSPRLDRSLHSTVTDLYQAYGSMTAYINDIMGAMVWTYSCH